MNYNPRSSSSYSRKSTNFYSTTLHPPSYYSPKKTLYFQNNNKTYTLDSSPKSANRNIDNSNNKEKNIGLFNSSSNIKRIRASPFYNNEKSLRLQNEIDWINKIVTRKAIINRNTETNSNSNSMNDFINNEEKDISDLLRNKIRIEQLNNQLSNNRHNKSYNLKYKKFNYIDPCSFTKKDSIPLIIATKYKKSGLFSKNDFDNYNHKIFMNEMIKFKNTGLNKWRKDFINKFNEY